MAEISKQEMAKSQLVQLYEVISGNHKHSGTIRNWCVTVWVASLMLPYTGKIDLTASEQIAISLMPVALFWLLDGIQHCFVFLHQQRTRDLERIIARNAWDEYEPERFFYLAGWTNVTQRQKLESLFHCLFLHETVLAFYFLLVTGTLVLALILK